MTDQLAADVGVLGEAMGRSASLGPTPDGGLSVGIAGGIVPKGHAAVWKNESLADFAMRVWSHLVTGGLTLQIGQVYGDPCNCSVVGEVMEDDGPGLRVIGEADHEDPVIAIIHAAANAVRGQQ